MASPKTAYVTLFDVKAKASTRSRASPSASGRAGASSNRSSWRSSRRTTTSVTGRRSVDADAGQEGLLLLLELVEIDGAVLVLLVDGLHEADEVAGGQVALGRQDGGGVGAFV